MPLEVNINKGDMRHIRIACRCGEKFVTAVPEPLLGALTLTLCPKCRRPFGIQKRGDDWKIKPIEPGEFRGTVAVPEDLLEELMKKGLKQAKKIVDDVVEEKDDLGDGSEESGKKPFVN